MNPSSPPPGLDSDLESFRQQWLSDLQSQKVPQPSVPAASHPQQAPSTSHASHAPSLPPPPASRAQHHPEEEEDYIPGRSFDGPVPPQGYALGDGPKTTSSKELVSALDHYEEAMEKEAEGKLGDSLSLYRQAYRLDAGVDRRYREKHFPPAPPSISGTSHPAAKRPVAASQKPSLVAPAPAPAAPEPTPIPLAELVASFSNLSVTPAGPMIEGATPPPCPIAEIPTEVLTHVLLEVAMDDVGDFVRLALVCKQFAYLVATEERLWKHVCLSSQWGFPGMHHDFAKTVTWEDVDNGILPQTDGSVLSREATVRQQAERSTQVTLSLVPSTYPSWLNMFRARPRIRFNGCYISTVNYIRSGQASTNQNTWGQPIHIVTYYRYLRFFRDGTVISLLSTTQPSDVVHHLTKDSLTLHHGSKTSYLPSAMMCQALKGRWRLSTPTDHGGGPEEEARPTTAEGDLYIETEGAGPKYVYRMDLAFKSAGKGSRNNKLIWKGFWSYNKLTDDWAAFTLKNDKAFFFSRVKSFGIGE